MRTPKAALFPLLCVTLASAAEAAPRHRLNLPAGRLGDAITALGRQAGVSIGISDPTLAGLPVPATRGTFTVDQALRRLLSGRSARAVIIDMTTIRVVRTVAPPPPRPAPSVRTARAKPLPPPPRAMAAQQDTAEPVEIIVTASRRAIPLSSYPGTISIVAKGDPWLSSVHRGSDALVSRLPSLSSTHLGPGRNKLFIRGISESSFNGPTQALVGQYLGETRLNYNAPDPDLRLVDLDRLEVLAGPQGTLYGAGSLGGIMRLVPAPPDAERTEASLSMGAALTQHGDEGHDAVGILNVPLAEGRLAARFNGYSVSEGGYIDDPFRKREDVNRVRIVGGRAAVRATFDPEWTIDLAATGQRIRGKDAQWAERGQKPLARRSSLAQPFANDYLLGSAVTTREFGDLRFLASLGLVRQKLEERFQATRLEFPPAAYDLTTDVSLFSAETRLSSQSASGAGWIVGAALHSNRSHQSREVEQFGKKRLRNRVENEVTEKALFGEGSVSLLPNVIATAGGRLVASGLSSSGFAFKPGFPLPAEPKKANRSNTRFLPAAAISYEARPGLLLYGRYQQSFRAGGLVVLSAPLSQASEVAEEFVRVRPDRLAAIETGVRLGTPGVGSFDAAAAFAYSRWSNVQADTIDIFAEPTTGNIGDARIYTLDVNFGWRPHPSLAFEAGGVFNDSALRNLPPGTSTDPSPPLPGVARFNGRLAAHYAALAFDQVKVRLSAAARYTGRSNLGAGDFLRRPQGDWLEASLFAEAQAGRHSVTLGITNLFDTHANRFALGSPFLLSQKNQVTPVRPRTVRLAWQVGF